MKVTYALAPIAALSIAACSQAETDAAKQDADAVATDTGNALEGAGQDLGEAAHETGEAVEGAVHGAATEVEHATDDNPNTN